MAYIPWFMTKNQVLWILILVAKEEMYCFYDAVSIVGSSKINFVPSESFFVRHNAP